MNVNGFVFNLIGDLISEPELASLDLLKGTLTKLYEKKEYIKASRIQHRINVVLFNSQSDNERVQLS